MITAPATKPAGSTGLALLLLAPLALITFGGCRSVEDPAATTRPVDREVFGLCDLTVRIDDRPMAGARWTLLTEYVGPSPEECALSPYAPTRRAPREGRRVAVADADGRCTWELEADERPTHVTLGVDFETMSTDALIVFRPWSALDRAEHGRGLELVTRELQGSVSWPAGAPAEEFHVQCSSDGIVTRTERAPDGPPGRWRTRAVLDAGAPRDVEVSATTVRGGRVFQAERPLPADGGELDLTLEEVKLDA